MKRLILYPSAVAQWHALVRDAEKLSKNHLNEELENYLVLLLHRFVDKAEFASRVTALDYLNNLEKSNYEQQLGLRDVGDQCLLISGLYPQLSIRRRVPIIYYVELGQRSYHLLTIQDRNKLTQLFCGLEKHFVALMDTLQYMRELTGEHQSISLLQAEELWREKQSKHALDILRRHTNNSLPIAGNNSKQILH